jgi:Glutathione S-transferase, N-terminal domain
MKLYVCWGTWTGVTPRPFRRAERHPCGVAHEALKDAGYKPQVVRCFGWTELPDVFNLTPGRRRVKQLTGKNTVPVLVTDDEEVIAGSSEIVAWARRPVREYEA